MDQEVNLSQFLGTPFFEEWQHLKRIFPDAGESEWHRSEIAARALVAWNTSKDTVLAALALPFVEQRLLPQGELRRLFGSDPVEIAVRFVERFDILAGYPSYSQGSYNYQLRYLFRQAYLELPSPDLILLVLANNVASICSGSVDPEIWAEITLEVFIPLAEILGLWRLRRSWLQTSMAFKASASNNQGEILESLEGYFNGYQQWVAEETGSRLSSTCPASSPTLLADRPPPIINGEWLRTQVNVYEELKADLVRIFKNDASFPEPKVEPVELSSGMALHRINQGIPKEELIDRLRIRVRCNERQDCYRVLGYIHSLGKPVGNPDTEYFSDFVAAPQTNGYQAIHTSILYRSSSSRTTIVEVRITTHRMHYHNEFGIIAAKHSHPNDYSGIPSWWNQLDGLTRDLQKLSIQTKSQAWPDILAFLDRFAIDTLSPCLYLFTPKGEIVLLPEGSTPLDFAYRIHTNLGHHAIRIEVNGKLVPYNYNLRNGDMVLVHYDESFCGPDLSWLNFVATTSAKAKVRRGLRNHSASFHPGRGKIETVLLKFAHQFMQDRKYDLGLTTHDLESFLTKYVRVNGYPSTAHLYEDVHAGKMSAYKLVHQLISHEFAAALLEEDGPRVRYPIDSILFCDRCRPIPGDSLIAFERHATNTTTGLIVHRSDDGGCADANQSTKRIFVKWAERTYANGNNIFVFQIEAGDRRGVLAEILNIVYDERGANLLRVEAQAHLMEDADIEFVVELENVERLSAIRRSLEKLSGVHRVFPFPASHTRSLAVVAGTQRPDPNPYTYQEVYDRLMFYDREKPVSDILQWLQQDPPFERIIVHGPRRVGKTSLAKYLVHEIIPKRYLARAVFSDAQEIPWLTCSIEEIATYITKEVFDALQQPMPVQEPQENCVQWFSRALEVAVSSMEGGRLFLVIDEFDALLKKGMDGTLDSQVFFNLRAVMNQRREINWLLIVSDANFKAPERWGAAGPLFQQARSIELSHLDPHWAHKLITEPLERCGMKYRNDAIPRQILHLTAGNPYIIHVLCQKLIDGVRGHNRLEINRADVDLAADHVIDDGRRIFHHFMRALSLIEKIVLVGIVTRTNSGEWQRVDQIVADIQHVAPELEFNALTSAIRAVERHGALELRDLETSFQARVSIGLFHQWVGSQLRLADVVAEWRSTRRRDRE